MSEIIPWLFILPPVVVTIVALAALGWRYTPAGKARQFMVEGGQHLYRKEFDEAEACFRKGLELQPANPALLGTLASLLVSVERFDEALPVLDKVLGAQPGDARLLLVKGRCLYGQGDVEGALKIWGALPKEADVYLEAQTVIAAHHEDQGDLDQALATLEGAVASGVGDTLQKRDINRALRRIKKAVAAPPKPKAADAPAKDAEEEVVQTVPAARKRASRARARAKETATESSDAE